MAMELSGSPGLVGVYAESGASACLIVGLSASLHRALSCAVVLSLTSLSVVACAPSASRRSIGLAGNWAERAHEFPVPKCDSARSVHHDRVLVVLT